MSFWGVMNWIAWGLCGVLFFLLMSDFLKVESEKVVKKKAK